MGGNCRENRYGAAGLNRSHSSGQSVRAWLLAGAATAGMGAVILAAPAIATADTDTGASTSTSKPSTSSTKAGPAKPKPRGASSRAGSAMPERAGGSAQSPKATAQPAAATPASAAAVTSANIPANTKKAAASVVANSATVATPTAAPILARITTGNGAKGIVISADGAKAYVANQSQNTVSVIDVGTDTKLAKDINVMPLGLHPTQLALSPDNKTLYVVNQSGMARKDFPGLMQPPTLSTIDLATQQIKTTPISTLDRLRGTRIGNLVTPVVTGVAVGHNDIYVTDSTIETPTTIPTEPTTMDWQLMDVSTRLMKNVRECRTPQCSLYSDPTVSNLDVTYGHISNAFKGAQKIIDGVMYGLFKIEGFATAPVAIAVAPGEDNGYVYSINASNGFAYVFDPYRKVMIDAIFLGTHSIDDKSSKVWLKIPSLDKRLVVNDTVMPTAISFRPDGNSAYVTNSNSGEVVVLDTNPANFKNGGSASVAARIQIPKLETSMQPIDIAVSPDGKYACVLSTSMKIDPRKAGLTSLTVIDLATNTVVGSTSSPLEAKASVTGLQIAVTDTKAFITTKPVKGSWKDISSHWLGEWGAKSEVLVVDLAKMRTNLGAA
jgi:YVTN family beta-propeller protein